MKKILDFIRNHFDFSFYGVTWIALLFGLAIIPCLKFMPQEFGFENGLLENIQMGVLFIILGLCLTAKYNKRFFKFAALALTIIMIREVNCGRTLFFPIPGEYHKYYSWRDLPWPWLGKTVHTLYGLWMVFVGLVFIIKKFYIDLWRMIRDLKLPVWNLLFMGFASFMGAIAEKATNNNFIFEEGFELFFYVSLLGLVYLYSRHKNFMLETEEE